MSDPDPSILQFNSFQATVYSVFLVKIMFCNAQDFVDKARDVLKKEHHLIMLLSLFRRRQAWEKHVSLPIVRQLFRGQRGPRFAHAILESESSPIRPCALFGKLLLGASKCLHEAATQGLVLERTHDEICTWFDVIASLQRFRLFGKFNTQVQSGLKELTLQEREYNPNWEVAKHYPFFNTTVLAISLAQMVQSLIEEKQYPDVLDLDLWSKLPGQFFQDLLGLDARGMTCVETDEAKLPYFNRAPYELFHQRPKVRGGGKDFFYSRNLEVPEVHPDDDDLEDPQDIDDHLFVAPNQEVVAGSRCQQALLRCPFFNVANAHSDVLHTMGGTVVSISMKVDYVYSPEEETHVDQFSDTIRRVEGLSEEAWQKARKHEKWDRYNVKHNLKFGWQSTWSFQLEDDRFVLGNHSLQNLLWKVQLHCRHARRRGRFTKRSLLRLAHHLTPNDNNV